MTNAPAEVENLFNPIFCSLLIHNAATTYFASKNFGIDFALSFLVLPIALHQETRQRLPNRRTTKMHVWLQNNPDLLLGFSGRARSLSSISKQALLFGLQASLLTLSDSRLVSQPAKIAKYKFPTNSEAQECRTKAGMIGKLFADAGETKEVFLMWGIRP